MKSHILFTLIIGLVIIFGLSLINKNILHPEPAKDSKAEFVPIRLEVGDLTLSATSALSIYFDEKQSIILYEKEKDNKTPIASVTKLLTAYTVMKDLDTDQEIIISQKAIDQYETAGKLEVGQKLKIKDLLYPLLIESSNDAAYAIAESYGYAKFITAMNKNASSLGMENSLFQNPHGLDTSNQYSTVNDVALLVRAIDREFPELFEIGINPFYGNLVNTNKLLTATSSIPFKIIGGKTGETPLAKQALVMIFETPNKQGKIINVILVSDDRNKDMLELSKWIKESYTW
jgi:D-alanyl-D-alanine carboxypeptidase (penicillin-binding protein 5/6)